MEHNKEAKEILKKFSIKELVHWLLYHCDVHGDYQPPTISAGRDDDALSVVYKLFSETEDEKKKIFQAFMQVLREIPAEEKYNFYINILLIMPGLDFDRDPYKKWYQDTMQELVEQEKFKDLYHWKPLSFNTMCAYWYFYPDTKILEIPVRNDTWELKNFVARSFARHMSPSEKFRTSILVNGSGSFSIIK